MESLGKHINARRKRLRITQKQLADLAGVSINTLTKMERGEGNPSLETLSKVLDTLGLILTTQIKTPDE